MSAAEAVSVADHDDSGGVRFDTGMAALEALVAQLESGELPLEDALAVFERGVALVRELNERLSAAEQRGEQLIRGPDGALRLQPLDDEES